MNKKVNEKKNLCIKEYELEGKTYFRLTVQRRNKKGRLIKRETRFTKTGQRITSLAVAEQVKYQLRREVDEIIEHISIYNWRTWIKKAFHEMRKDGFKEGTIKNYEAFFNKWIPNSWQDKDLSSFTRDDIYKFIHEEMDNKLASDWTKRNLHKSIRKFFNMAIEHGEMSKNPAAGIKVHVTPSEGEVLTPEEINILLSKGKLINHPYYPHWVLALMTGMRCGELYALNWNNVDLEAGIIHVVEQFTSRDGIHLPKKQKTRPIDLSPELAFFLKELKKNYGTAEENLWSWKFESHLVDEVIAGRATGEKIYKKVKIKQHFKVTNLVLPRIARWRQGAQAKELKAFCKKIGIKEIKFHDLRASHITNLLSNGVAISKVMKQVGHSKMSTTDAYHRFTGVEIKGVTNSLSFNIPKKENGGAKIIKLFKSSSQS